MSELSVKEIQDKYLNTFLDNLFIKMDKFPGTQVSALDIQEWAEQTHGKYLNQIAYDRLKIDSKVNGIISKCHIIDGKVSKAEFRKNANSNKLLIN